MNNNYFYIVYEHCLRTVRDKLMLYAGLQRNIIMNNINKRKT